MRIVTLGEVCSVVSGSTPKREKAEFWNGNIPWITPKEISRLTSPYLLDSEEKITKEGFSSCSTSMLPVGSVLLSSRAPIGLLAINKIPVCTNQGFKSLVPSNKVNSEYLYYVLKANVQALQARGNGATFKELAKPAVEKFEIPLPPLNDQIRIAHLLGKVDGLIAQRKQHLQQLDDLLKSVFLEMFAPSAEGHDDWPLVEIKDLAEKHKGAMRTGPFGSNLLHSEFIEDGDVAVLGIDNAVQNRFAWGERRYITQEKYQELQNYRIYAGDVIVTIMGTIGRSAVIPNDIPLAINTKHLAAITLNKNIANPIFVSYSIHSSPYILNQFKSKNRGAIMSGLNLGLIKETKLKRPPIGAQNRFATIHEKVDEVKRSYQQSLFELESLYGALSQQAFKGELDLSHVPLPLEHSNQNAGEVDTSANVEITIPLSDFFQIPEDANTAEVQTDKGKQDFLKTMLSAWLKQFSHKSFSLNNFMDTVQNQLWKLTDGESNLDTKDYDAIKGCLFETLADGKLAQVYDENNNHIKITTASAKGKLA